MAIVDVLVGYSIRVVGLLLLCCYEFTTEIVLVICGLPGNWVKRSNLLYVFSTLVLVLILGRFVFTWRFYVMINVKSFFTRTIRRFGYWFIRLRL